MSPAWKRKKLKIEILLAIQTKITGEGQTPMSQIGSPTGGPTLLHAASIAGKGSQNNGDFDFPITPSRI
jgi:hypothetical protein